MNSYENAGNKTGKKPGCMKRFFLMLIVQLVFFLIFIIPVMVVFMGNDLKYMMTENSLVCSWYSFPSEPLFGTEYVDINDRSYESIKDPFDRMEAQLKVGSCKIRQMIYNELRQAIFCKCDPEKTSDHYLWFSVDGKTGAVGFVKTASKCDEELIQNFPFNNVVTFDGEVTYKMKILKSGYVLESEDSRETVTDTEFDAWVKKND